MTLTGEEIAKHNSKESCWVIVHGKAYDVTEVSFFHLSAESNTTLPLCMHYSE